MKVHYPSKRRILLGFLVLLLPTFSAFSQCFELPSSITISGSLSNQTVGDLNGDEKPDIVTVNFENSTVSVLLNQGGGTFSAPTNFSLVGQPGAVIIVDVNKDEKPDLAISDGGDSGLAILLGNGDGSFQDPITYETERGSDVSAGDLNGDEWVDLVTANYSDNSISVLINKGDGTFLDAVNYEGNTDPTGITIADFNDDGDLDLATSNVTTNDVSVFLGNGDGTFNDPVKYSVDIHPNRIRSGDFNEDNRVDLVTVSPDNKTVSILLGNGDGTFGLPTNYAVSGKLPLSVTVADINNDAHLDLITANAGSSDISVFEGQGDGTFGAPTVIPVENYPRFVNASDLNADGKVDLVTEAISAQKVQLLLACVPPTLTAFSASSNPVCPGQPVQFTATVGHPTASYSYTLTNGIDSPLSGTATTAAFSQTLTASSTDVQSYTLTVATGGGTVSSSVSLTVNTALTLTLSANVTSGTPGSFSVLQNTPGVVLSASGCSGTVAWSGPGTANGSSLTVPTSATGTLVYSATCTAGICTSPPATFTATVTSSTVTGSFDGFIYGADCSTFRGWTWDRNKPNTAFSVEILDGPNVIGTLLANVFRQDLQTAGKGNGKHAFFFTIPENLKNGVPHNLSARILESGFILKDSPKALICQTSGVPDNKPPVPPASASLPPLLAQAGVPFSTTLAAFTDTDGTIVSYGISGLPSGLSLVAASRVISGTPTVAGEFVLAYQAIDDDGASNSVSLNLTVNPASTTTVTGSFEGYLDKVECATIRGWVWDRNKPNAPVTVEFYTTDAVLGSTVANSYRDDLKNAGKGNGAHAYSFTVPNELKDGHTRLIYGRVLGSTYILKDSGKPLTCSSPVRLSAETGSELQVTVLGNPVVGGRLSVEIRGAEGQSVQLQLTDVRGRVVSHHQLDQAKPVEHQQLAIGPHATGLLVLRVSSGLKSVTLKLVNP